MEGLRGETGIAEICRKEGIAQNLYYRWSKDFLESGKKRFDGDTMRASDEFKDKTTRVNQMWQTDFTYFKIIGWGWFYLSTILDDYSRHIVTWELCSGMTS